MTESMVERVARAIRESEEWSSFWGEEESMVLARAAMKAMREPTQEMANAGWSAIANNADDPQGAAWPIWHAMIDAALDEKEQTDA